jgi:hypothetical protein
MTTGHSCESLSPGPTAILAVGANVPLQTGRKTAKNAKKLHPKSLSRDAAFIRSFRTQTAEGLGRIIGRRLWDSFGSPSKAAEALSWSLYDIESWEKGRQVFDMEQALQLAKAIDVDGSLFVGKALELTLRRDFSNTLGV